MRIENKVNKNKSFWKWIALAISFFLLLFLGYSLWPNAKSSNAQYFCDAELFSEGEFLSGSHTFSTSCVLDKTESKSGNASCRCGGDMRFGPTLKLNDLRALDTLVYSLYLKTKGNVKVKLVLSGGEDQYFAKDITANESWKNHQFSFVLPDNSSGYEWKIYPYLVEGMGPVFFDDMRIDIRTSDIEKNESGELPQLALQINEANFKKIRSKRQEAMTKGLLFSSKADMVDADFRVDGITYNCQTRLKGDLLDHLKKDKWSFRIVMDGNETWNQMNIFSVHNSKSRSHLAEWVMHEMMRQQGILSPRYGFLKFSLNQNALGVYAYEQHFDNHFLLENKRMIGPILRHNDNGYWDNVQSGILNYDWAISAQIELFNKENDGDGSFMKLFEYGHSQLNDYLNGRKQAKEVFDMDKMAKYYALIEIGHGTHAQLLTNIRFYANPTSGLLEPIGYDFYGDHFPNITEDWRPVGQWENGKNVEKRSKTGYTYLRHLFGDQEFYGMYLNYLNEFTSKSFLENTFENLESRIMSLSAKIKQDKDYRDYTYDFYQHFRKAEFTRLKLHPLKNVSLKSYRSKKKHEVFLQGFHYFPIEVIGYKSNDRVYMLEEAIVLDAYSPDSGVISHSLIGQQKPKEIIFRTLGVDSLFYHKVNNTILPVDRIATQMSKLKNLSDHVDFSKIGNVLVPESSEIIIDQSYHVEKGESLLISAGTTIRFVGPGSLSISGEIRAIGTENNRITFKGKSRLGQGILLRNSQHDNLFSKCTFTNLGQYSSGVVDLEGAINIDESKATFLSCTFIKNDAKVDLKFSNSTFRIEEAQFRDNIGSGIKALFSTGDINDISGYAYGSTFLNQFGGRITGKNWKIYNCLDWIISLDQFAMMNLEGFSHKESQGAVQVAGHSEFINTKYEGLSKGRDIQITGREKPFSKIVLGNVVQPGKIKYIVEPGNILKINGSKKISK